MASLNRSLSMTITLRRSFSDRSIFVLYISAPRGVGLARLLFCTRSLSEQSPWPRPRQLLSALRLRRIGSAAAALRRGAAHAQLDGGPDQGRAADQADPRLRIRQEAGEIELAPAALERRR